jgi:hypothetical protein
MIFMISTARQKIDPQTRDMFDPEVDSPDHDKILTRLFGDDEALLSMLTALHGMTVLPSITDKSTFHAYHYPHSTRSVVTYSEAVEMTGVYPTWKTTCPIRDIRKQMETPLLWANERSSYSRVIGFVDICVGYKVAKWPQVEEGEKGQFRWALEEEQHHTLIEVKGKWPSAGNLIRQLNLYRAASASGFGGRFGGIVVGPNASMNDIVCQHGYRLATFDPDLTGFHLVPGPPKPVKQEAITPGQL